MFFANVFHERCPFEYRLPIKSRGATKKNAMFLVLGQGT
jgi:hypothetical protein